MKKKLVGILLASMLLAGCSSFDRACVDFKSDINNGLDRTIVVYTADGDVIAKYTGKIDLEQNESFIKFDYEGKRYIYYNCFVETIADID